MLLHLLCSTILSVVTTLCNLNIMDGCLNIMDGWMDRWIDGWIDGSMDRWMDRSIGGWMDGWMDRSIDRETVI